MRASAAENRAIEAALSSVDLIKNHLVKPLISHRFPLESANEAISVVRNGTSIGRVVLEF